MSLHLELKEHIKSHFSDQLEGEPTLRQDALQIQFDTGLLMELRYLNRDEYSLKWLWGDAELRIDTAPLHADLSTYPNHFHDADANLRPDPVTVPGREPWDNVRELIGRVLQDPLLETK